MLKKLPIQPISAYPNVSKIKFIKRQFFKCHFSNANIYRNIICRKLLIIFDVLNKNDFPISTFFFIWRFLNILFLFKLRPFKKSAFLQMLKWYKVDF